MSVREPRQQVDKLQSFVARHRQIILWLVLFLLVVGTAISMIDDHFCTEKAGICWWAKDVAVVLNSLGIAIMFLQLILAFPIVSASSEQIQTSTVNRKVTPRNIEVRPTLTDA